MKAKALIIPAEGPEELREIDTDLATLQGLVGGLIEPVPVAPGVHLWVNEEGTPLGLPFNLEASRISGRFLRGTVVMLGQDDDGNDADLPEAWAVALPGPEVTA